MQVTREVRNRAGYTPVKTAADAVMKNYLPEPGEHEEKSYLLGLKPECPRSYLTYFGQVSFHKYLNRPITSDSPITQEEYLIATLTPLQMEAVKLKASKRKLRHRDPEGGGWLETQELDYLEISEVEIDGHHERVSSKTLRDILVKKDKEGAKAILAEKDARIKELEKLLANQKKLAKEEEEETRQETPKKSYKKGLK